VTAAFDANEARILELFWCGIKRGAVNRTLHSQRSAVPTAILKVSGILTNEVLGAVKRQLCCV